MNPVLNRLILIATTIFFASCAGVMKRPSGSQNRFSNQSEKASVRSPLSNEQNILQELTGRTPAGSPSEAVLKNAPMPVRHYYAGQRAAEQKNYIMAIKHFNTVIKKYPNSAQVKPALLAKAKIYKEMGLIEPAQFNMQMAQRKINFKSKSRIVKNSIRKNSTNSDSPTVIK